MRPSSTRAESKRSWARTPTSGLAASVCCTAWSGVALSSWVMGAAPSDQHAQQLCDEGRLRFVLYLERAVQLEKQPSAVLRLGRDESRPAARPGVRLDRSDETDFVQAIIE